MEASASQVVDSSPVVDESALPVNKQIHREQIAAEQIVESVKEVPQERLPEPIEVPSKNSPSPHSIVAPTPREEGPSRWKRHLAAQAPVIEHMTPAPVSCSAPAPVIDDISPGSGVTPVPAFEHVASAPEIGYVASAQPVTFFVEQTMEQIIDLPSLRLRKTHRSWCRLPAPANAYPSKAAADEKKYVLCLGSCKTRSSWLLMRGHLYDTRVMAWTVY